MSTLNLQVGASLDDTLTKDTCTNFNTNANVDFGDFDVDDKRWGGWRFNNVTVAQGSTVSVATLTIYINTTSRDDPEANIYCEDADDAVNFDDANPSLHNRTLTTAFTLWSASTLGVGDASPPDLSDEVEEVFVRGTWGSGNDLVVIANPVTSGSKTCRSDSYDTSPTNAGRLDLTFTAPGGDVRRHIIPAYMRLSA